MNGWTVPAVAIFLLTQASAAVWWASGTNNQVDNNTVQIGQVVENEKQIAVMEVKQDEIQKDVIEVKAMVQDIYHMITRWDGE
jgi:hypothetical protein